MPADDTRGLPDGSLLAALDLGSNSFHLLLVKIEHGEIRPIEALAEKVQLAAGLEDNVLSAAAIERGLACLERFAQLISSVEPERLRIVGTNALRVAQNRRAFTLPAEALLGARVDVIYGREEARLVYLGVAHALADDGRSRLVIDIGGGSTEFIIGERFEALATESLQIGCVSYTSSCFADGHITPERFREVEYRTRAEVLPIRHRYHRRNWAECVGSSGTLQAIETLLLQNGWGQSGITRDGLQALRDELLEFHHFDDIRLDGLSPARRNVIVPGVAIATALFEILDIEHMRTSKGALREGVIYDLLGRLRHEDVRERTVSALMQRYSVDANSADVAEQQAQLLFSATAKGWHLLNSDWELLRWAARCHELGMAISHKHYQRHTAYVLLNSDLPGFSQLEQEQLALLTLTHRGKLSPELLDDYEGQEQRRLRYLVCLMRLATCFRHVEELPQFAVLADRDHLAINFPRNWLLEHPLSAWQLQEEEKFLAQIGIAVKIR